MKCKKCGKKLSDTLQEAGSEVTGEVAAHDNSYLDITAICSCGGYFYTFIPISQLNQEEEEEEDFDEFEDWE